MNRKLTDEEISDVIALSEETVKILRESVELGVTSMPLSLSIDYFAENIVQPCIDDLAEQILDVYDESCGKTLH